MKNSRCSPHARPIFLAIALFFALSSAAAAAELAFARSGPPGAAAKLIIQPTNEPATRLEAWEVIEEFQVRSVNISEQHIGYPDLKHGQINYEYGIPESTAPKRYFRKQTITSTWAAEYERALPGTLSGSMNLTIQMDDLFTETIAGSWNQQEVSQYREIVGQDMYGGYVYGPNIYTATKTWAGTAEPAFSMVLGARTVALPSTLTYNSGKPGSTDEVSSWNAYGSPYWWADSIGPSFWGAAWMSHSGTGVGAAFGASPPADWTETRVVFQTSGVGAYEPPRSASFNYTLALSEEDTKAHVLARFEQSKSFGNLESLPWNTERRIRRGGADIEDDEHWSDSWLFLYNESEYFESDGYIEYDKAQIRFVVPAALRLPGVAYRARLIETFYPNNPPYDAQVVAIFEAELREGQWESPIYTVTARDNGSTEVQYLSTRAELIQPHKIVALAAPAAGTAPVEYAASRPTLQTQFLLPNAGGQDYAERQVLTGSTTLQQIDLADAWGSLWDFDTASAKWSILPGATATVRLWHWKDDGSPLGKWTLLAPGAELRDYFGSSSDFIFAEAASGGQATVRITIDVGGKQVHDDLVVQAESVSALLAVDANRDGTINFAPDATDATSADRPYRFWVNDDNDRRGTWGTNSGGYFETSKDEVASSVTPNFLHWAPASARDLEDFSRLGIRTSGISSALKNGDLYLGLRWTNVTGAPAIKIVTHIESDGGVGYLNNMATAALQVEQIKISDTRDSGLPWVDQRRAIQGNEVFILPAALFSRLTESAPTTHFLFEGAGVGKGLLQAVILKKEGQNYTIVGEGEGIWLDLKNIKSMYERAVATTGGARSANGVDYTIPIPSNYTGPDPNNFPHPTMGWQPNELGFPFQPDSQEIKTYIVYVHGWRWSPEKANNRAETVFKRLWHAGYRGRLAALRWPTFYGGPDDDDSEPEGYLTFNQSEYRAWKSGESLKKYVNGEPSSDGTGRIGIPAGYTRNVVAHSMGNFVASEALKSGMAVQNYAMLNAAVSASCYDENPNLRQWDYTTPNTDTDPGTKSLAYAGRFSTLNTNVINFYLINDSATLGLWNLNNGFAKPYKTGAINLDGVVQYYGYEYWPTNPPGSRLKVTFVSDPARILIDPHEVMPYGTRSLTYTSGAEHRTAGSINDKVNMDALFQFGTEHGAEWDRSIQAAGIRDFYRRLLEELRVSVP